ncbi:MAG: lytic transglycosylase domain-containing protein [Pseudomonadota bacterium]
MRFLVKSAVIGLTALAASIVSGAAPASAADFERVLNERDAELYTEIFDLQERGAWAKADAKINQLSDRVLVGYVLHQRYMHPTAYRSKFSELKKWMAYYADHPNAGEIYRLALRRRPKGASSPVRPARRQWRSAENDTLHPALEADYKRVNRPRVRKIEGRVRYLSRKERATQALNELAAHRKRGVITERQYDRMRSWAAASLYYQGYVAAAKRVANDAAKKNGETAVLAHWISGLIAFRENDAVSAHKHFAAMARVPHQDDDLRSAAAFWAARTALAAQEPAAVAPHLELAATYPFTFYGQLGLAQLGREFHYDWSTPSVSDGQVSALLKDYPGVRRAIALSQAGRIEDAELEMRWANGAIEDVEAEALMVVASGLNLPASQMEIAMAGDQEKFASGLFPVPDYSPKGGFKTDRAIIYAVMRQESKFRQSAKSRVGARGLMQIMPRTASYVAKDRSLQWRSGRDRLFDPALNLEIGQRYVNQLISNDAKGNLFKMAVAYNGGPGNMRRWDRKMGIDDPLLFVESIPNPESRDYVEKVLTNIWVYRARLGQPAPTRDKVAAGALPVFEAVDQLTADAR